MLFTWNDELNFRQMTKHKNSRKPLLNGKQLLQSQRNLNELLKWLKITTISKVGNVQKAEELRGVFYNYDN